MSLKNLVASLAATTQLPVLVDDVRSWLIKNGLQDEIWFVKADFDLDVLYGAIKQYIYRPTPYGEPLRVSNIYYGSSLNVCWSRLVCCKEMMHIFDTEDQKASSRELVSGLTSEMGSPPLPGKMSERWVSDWLAIVKALAVLVPEPTLEALRPHYDSGAKKPYDVALFLRIPEFYADYLFSDLYREHRAVVLL